MSKTKMPKMGCQKQLGVRQMTKPQKKHFEMSKIKYWNIKCWIDKSKRDAEMSHSEIVQILSKIRDAFLCMILPFVQCD